MESTSIVLNRSRIRFSDIQLEEIAKRNFSGQHYTVTDIQPFLLFLLFYAIIDSSVTSPHKSLLITPTAPPPPPPPPEVERHQESLRGHLHNYLFPLPNSGFYLFIRQELYLPGDHLFALAVPSDG